MRPVLHAPHWRLGSQQGFALWMDNRPELHLETALCPQHIQGPPCWWQVCRGQVLGVRVQLAAGTRPLGPSLVRPGLATRADGTCCFFVSGQLVLALLQGSGLALTHIHISSWSSHICFSSGTRTGQAHLRVKRMRGGCWAQVPYKHWLPSLRS